jgi:hypothetical protein
VGQYIGHTAPNSKGVQKKTMGSVMFVDWAHYLYRPGDERDYWQGAIEILLQIVESNGDDPVVILAGYADWMAKFFLSNTGFCSRIAQPIELPDCSGDELARIATLIQTEQNCTLSPADNAALGEYTTLRRTRPHFANARSFRNALDWARLRQANWPFSKFKGPLDATALSTIDGADIRGSRVFKGGLDSERSRTEG